VLARTSGAPRFAASSGTIVDVTLIHASSSTKNEAKARGPDMHQTKKSNQWYFGMKAHFGVDRRAKVIHSVVATAANVRVKAKARSSRRRHQGTRPVQPAVSAPRRYEWAERARNRVKSKVRSRVERVIGVIKLKFGFAKMRYRGLEKNANRLFATCGLTNLNILRHQFRTA
jgi:IS5 family transposase